MDVIIVVVAVDMIVVMVMVMVMIMNVHVLVPRIMTLSFVFKLFSKCLTAASWTRITGELKQIDAGPAGAVWGVSTNNQTDKLNTESDGWIRLDGRLKHVSAGPGDVRGVNKKADIFYREGKLN